MCVTAISFQENSEFPIILAANRDEFYARAAEPLQWWPDAPEILAGRDVSQAVAGTWLGINRSGYFAILTNFREVAPQKKDAQSRGMLIRDFLARSPKLPEFAAELVLKQKQFNGYNLIFGNRDTLYYYSNRSGEPATKLPPGLYGLSNALLDAPWPKVTRLKAGFASVAQSLLPTESVFAILADSTRSQPTEVQQTGLPMELEVALSPVFIALPERGYGTRVSSILSIAATGQVKFLERTFYTGKFKLDTKVEFEITG
jgi:uncharacterized protein with NRDE domain